MTNLSIHFQKRRLKSVFLLLLIVLSSLIILYSVGSQPPERPNNSSKESLSSNENIPSFRQQIKVLKDKEMHQLGKHFSKHGRQMGYASKKEYQQGAIEFVEKCKNNPAAKFFEGKWNGGGSLDGSQQIVVSFQNRTAILDKTSGKLIDFYTGTEWRGLIELIAIP